MLPPNTTLLSIVPLVPIPTGKSAMFSYLPPSNGETPPRGSIVSIPFGARTVRGVVWGPETSPPPTLRHIRYKAVRKVLAESYLSESTLAFAECLAQESYIALGTALERFVPKTLESIPPLAHRKHLPLTAIRKKYTLTSEQTKTLKALLASRTSKTLLYDPSGTLNRNFLFEILRKHLHSDSHDQALILVPDQAILRQEEPFFRNVFGSTAIGIYHSLLKERERAELQRAIQSGSARILLGTTSSLFLPFRNIRLVIEYGTSISSSESLGVPFTLHAHDALQKFAEVHGARMIYISSTPSFASYIHARDHNELITPPPSESPHLSWHTVNLRLEKWKKKLAPITEDLRFAIASALDRKHQIILFVSRSGMSAFSICAECKKVLRCPSCSSPLSYQKNGEYRCGGCGAQKGATPSCFACGSLSFTHIGIGTERVERDLRRKFPGIRSVRYDKNTRNRIKTLSEIDAFIRGERDVLITTESGSQGWDLPQISLIAMIDADTLLGISRWDADERLLRTFLSIAHNAGRSDEHSSDVFLQTFHPENPIFDSLQKNELLTYFTLIEEERRQFLSPPYGLITRLSCRMSTEKKLLNEIERVQRILETAREEHSEKIYLTRSEITRRKRDRSLECHLTIREPTALLPMSRISRFEPIFRSLPQTWTLTKEL